MPEEKKIIIDEDWKTKVQAEKELEKELESQPKPDQPPASDESASADDVPMPPASFEMLLTTLATEAMMALGQIPHPATGQADYRPQQAKYLIDTIEIIQEKTQGNLTPVESDATENLLHQLRMAFVAGPPSADPLPPVPE